MKIQLHDVTNAVASIEASAKLNTHHQALPPMQYTKIAYLITFDTQSYALSTFSLCKPCALAGFVYAMVYKGL